MPNIPSRLYWTINAANNEATSDITVIIVFNDGPAVPGSVCMFTDARINCLFFYS